jgi:hemerythrin superfamily protein
LAIRRAAVHRSYGNRPPRQRLCKSSYDRLRVSPTSGDRDRRYASATIQFFNQQGETVMTTTTTTRKDESGEEHDAIEMLMADHKKVKKLFGNFATHKEDGDDEDKSAIVKLICNELKVHTTLEEEIFYPAVRKAIQDSALMDEALVEHAGAKDLIAQLEEVDPEDDLFDAKVTVLGEQIDHHVREEEGDMFPKAKKAKVDTAALGAQMLKRKAALMANMDETRSSDQKKKTGTR